MRTRVTIVREAHPVLLLDGTALPAVYLLLASWHSATVPIRVQSHFSLHRLALETRCAANKVKAAIL